MNVIFMTVLMVVVMIAAHACASPNAKAYSFTALIFTILLASITSITHFFILTVSR